MKIKFLQDRLVKDETNTLFKKDEVYELTESSCAHWISRGVAVEVEPKTKVGPPKVETATFKPPETTRSKNVPK